MDQMHGECTSSPAGGNLQAAQYGFHGQNIPEGLCGACTVNRMNNNTAVIASKVYLSTSEKVKQ